MKELNITVRQLRVSAQCLHGSLSTGFWHEHMFATLWVGQGMDRGDLRPLSRASLNDGKC